MSGRSQPALIVAGVAVGAAALFGIAAIEGWLPALDDEAAPDAAAPAAKTEPHARSVAPAEALLPGESVVTAPEAARAPATPAVEAAPQPTRPASLPPRADPVPAAKPAPQRPSYARAPSAAPERRADRGLCANCGTVVAKVRIADPSRGGAWEVRVLFDDGTRASLRFPTDPGFRSGERVLFANGRLQRD